MRDWIKSLRPLWISLGIAVVVYGGSYLLAPTYLGYFSLYFPNTSATPMLLAGIRSSAESDQGAVRNFGGALLSPLVGSGTQTATGILESTACAREVVRKCGLADRWRKKEGEAVEEFKDSLSVTVDKSGFLRVEITGESRELCTKMLDVMYGFLNRRAEAMTINVSQKNREFVEKRYDLAVKEVDRLQGGLTQMLTDFRLAGYDEIQGKYLSARSAIYDAKVQLKVAQAVLEINKKALKQLIELSQDEETSVFALPYVSGHLSGLASALESKRIALETAMTKFTDSSVEVQMAKRELNLTKRFADERLKLEDDALKEDLTPQFREARVQFETLKVTLAQNEEVLAKYEELMPVSASQYAKLERAKLTFNTAMAQMGTLRGELEVARIAEERDPSRYEMLDEPQTEWKPVGPRRALLAGIGFIGAMLIFYWPTIRARMREVDA